MSELTPLDHHSRALEFALGRMTPEEEAAFVTMMESAPDLQAEYAHAMEAISQIADAYAGSMPAPRKALKERVLDYATGKETSSDHSIHDANHYIVRSGKDGWIDSGLPGVMLKVLYADQASDRQTVLVRIEAGVHYPRHRHVGLEECLVLEGDLNMDNVRLKAGDFIVNPDGEIHNDTWTEEGCLLLLTGSLNDDYSI